MAPSTAEQLWLACLMPKTPRPFVDLYGGYDFLCALTAEVQMLG